MTSLSHSRVLVAGWAPGTMANCSGPTQPAKEGQLIRKHHRDPVFSRDGLLTAESEPWREAMKEAESRALGLSQLIGVTQCGEDLHVIGLLVTSHHCPCAPKVACELLTTLTVFDLAFPARLAALPPVGAGAHQQSGISNFGVSRTSICMGLLVLAETITISAL